MSNKTQNDASKNASQAVAVPGTRVPTTEMQPMTQVCDERALLA